VNTIKHRRKTLNEALQRKALPCSLISRINIFRIGTLLKEIYRFNSLPTKYCKGILHWNRKNNPKIHIKSQKIANKQSIHELKEQCWIYHNAWLPIKV
jgi:hypothetical protein